MSDHSSIEWTDATWNPVTGCTKVSHGCDHCYAETFAERFRGVPGHHFTNGFDIQLRPDKLHLPLEWRKPRRVFVNSMSDLFHDQVPDEYIADVFVVMALAKRHTFQVLTKRHARMRALLNSGPRWRELLYQALSWAAGTDLSIPAATFAAIRQWIHNLGWESGPLPNVWLGVSAENQATANLRVPALLDTPAEIRFVSAEPLLGPVDLTRLQRRPNATAVIDALSGDVWSNKTGEIYAAAPGRIDWVIVGGESGPGARPMHPNWARALRDQTTKAKRAFLFKQWGNWAPVGADAAAGHSIYDYVTNDDRCQIIDAAGRLRGRPWPGWKTQDGTHSGAAVRRYGKHAAGRVLDCRTWDEFPAGSERMNAGTLIATTGDAA